MSLLDLQARLRAFTAERKWERFHTPKNLAMALSNEVGELTEIFQWLTPEESATIMTDPDQCQHVREEVADVFAYLLRLCDVLGIDLETALAEKIIKNAAKYPAGPSRGSAAEHVGTPAPPHAPRPAAP